VVTIFHALIVGNTIDLCIAGIGKSSADAIFALREMREAEAVCIPARTINGTPLVGAQCRFPFVPLEAISSPAKFALKLLRQTPELQQ
jgi:hypothetical protein